MPRWIEIAGTSRKRLVQDAPYDPAELATANAKAREMGQAGTPPAGSTWNPSWSKTTLGYEVDSREKWNAELKKRNLVEMSPKESFLTKGRDLSGELEKSARKAATDALIAVKQGYRPPPVAARPAPPPPPPTPTDLPLSQVEALANGESLDTHKPEPGYVSQETLLGDMFKRNGWQLPPGMG